MMANLGLLAIIGFTCFLCITASNAESSSPSSDDEVYIILLKSPSYVQKTKLFQGKMPAEQGTLRSMRQNAMLHRGLLEESHDDILNRALGAGSSQRKLYSYTYLLNGFAASMSLQEACKIRRMHEVFKVERDYRMQKLTTYTPTYLGLENKAWTAMSSAGAASAGEGIVIGFVDTGIDPSHQSFANLDSHPYHQLANATSQFRGQCKLSYKDVPHTFCNGKIVAAHHFANAAKRSGLFNADVDYDSPFDGDGHGTHTASTAAGNHGTTVEVAGISFGNASGMAPRARLAIYKALYPGFGGFYSDVVAAIEKAAEDGVDILNLSIGPSRPPGGVATFFNVVDLALLAAVKAGVFVVQAAGNSGSSPYSIISFSPWIFTVAAVHHDRSYSNAVVLGNDITIKGLGLSPGTQGAGMHDLVLAKDAARNQSVSNGKVAIDECQDGLDFHKEKVQGKILVCSISTNFLMGSASVKNVEATATNLSASGVIFTTSSWMQGINLHVEFMPFKTPTIIVPQAEDSQKILDYCAKPSSDKYHEPSAKILGATAIYSHATPSVTYFSSRGPDPATSSYKAADVLKPNIAAPGASIWGAWTPHGVDSIYFRGENFALMSGTSMATPHIAGIAALVKQHNPDLSVAGIASAMSTTAMVRDGSGNSLLAEEFSSSKHPKQATPFDMGSGLVNATAAMAPGLIFDAGYEDYIRFLCAVNGGPSEVKRALGRSCPTSKDGEKQLPSDLNAPYITIATLEGRMRTMRQVTHISEATEWYEVSVDAPEGVSLEVNPTSFQMQCNEAKTLEVTMELSASGKTFPSFGSIVITGSHGHSARIPVAVISTSSAS